MKRALLWGVLLLGCTEKKDVKAVRVAAASDLAQAFTGLAQLHEQKTGVKVELTFGSSGLLARQIGESAPYDVFAAANVAFVEQVVKQGKCLADTQALYARGHVVLWAKAGTALTGVDALKGEGFKKIAIANPETAPYGKAAQEVLVSLGAWEAVEPKLVYAENVRQALQFAESGNADAAFVASTLVRGKGGVTLDVPESAYRPLHQAIVVCPGNKVDDSRARELVKTVLSEEGQALLKKHGFEAPLRPEVAP